MDQDMMPVTTSLRLVYPDPERKNNFSELIFVRAIKHKRVQ